MYPRLAIHRDSLYHRHTPKDVYLRFVIIQDGVQTYTLPCHCEDLLEFCSKICSTGFLMDCCGEGTACTLEYKWLHNILCYKTSDGDQYIHLTMENIEDIKSIANPRYKSRCVIS